MSDRHSSRARVWSILKVLNVRLRFILLMVVTGLIAANWENLANRWERLTNPPREQAGLAQRSTEYYCPMHPSVVRDEQGNCPICGMPLSARAKGEKPILPEGTLARVQLSPHRIQLAGVATSEVAFRAARPSVRGVGTIEADERRTARISARFGGRIEKLFVNFTGERVGKGDPLAEIYSPELVSAQQEYLIALRGANDRKGDDLLVEAARTKLRLWGLYDEQIEALEREGAPRTTVAIRSPISGVVTQKSAVQGMYVMEGTELYTVTDLSRVWSSIFLDPAATASVRVGDAVDVTVQDAVESFRSEVAFIYPVIDQATRTGRIRVDVPNPDGALRPGMFVNATVHAGSGASEESDPGTPMREIYLCPMHPEVTSEAPGTCPKCGMFLEKREVAATGDAQVTAGAGGGAAPRTIYTCPMHPEVQSSDPDDRCPQCGMFLEPMIVAAGGAVLAVPESAVIDTGTRKVVYLEREPGIFDAVEVTLGPAADGHVSVLRGLSPGDRVVTQGTFLVDAEARLNPGAAGAYFGASGGPR